MAALAAAESFENCDPESIAIISSMDMADRGARLLGESSRETMLSGWLYWSDDMLFLSGIIDWFWASG